LFLFNSKTVIFSYILQEAEEWDVKTVVMPPFLWVWREICFARRTRIL